jgi:competence protein ComEA
MSARGFRYITLAAVIAFSLSLLASQASATFAGGKVNINTASAQELTSLPGIGPKKADAIVSYRKANGAFGSVDDIVKVKGIGPKTLDKLRPLITVGKPSP